MLNVDQVTVRFGGLTAVNSVSFTVPQGKIVSVIGPNGAGKTTLFNAVSGIYQPTSGHIYFENHRISRPLAPATIAAFLLTALATALALPLVLNISGLWEVTIIAHYIYQEPFPWSAAVSDGVRYLRDLPLSWNVLPFLIGLLLGGGGSYALWYRSRRTPEVVARYGVARTLFQSQRYVENPEKAPYHRSAPRFLFLWHRGLDKIIALLSC